MMNKLISVIMLGAMMACTTSDKKEAKWFNDKDTARRVETLLKKMTLEEKIGQLTLFTSDMDQTGPFMRENYL